MEIYVALLDLIYLRLENFLQLLFTCIYFFLFSNLASSKKEKKPEKYVEVETWNGDSFLSLKEIKQT